MLRCSIGLTCVLWAACSFGQSVGATPPAGESASHIKDGYIDCIPGFNSIHLLESPGASKTVVMLGCSEKIAVLEEISNFDEQWDKVRTSAGVVGYIRRQFVSDDLATVQDQLQAQKLRATSERSKDISIRYAITATFGIRDVMLDPTAFTVLQVIAVTKQEKDGSTSFKGCIHYVDSNAFGGRLQRWGTYSVNKNGQLKWSPGSEYTACSIGKNDAQTDVTEEVKQVISQGDGR